MSTTKQQFYPNMFPVGTIFEELDGSLYRTISVWEIHNGFFAVNAVEVAEQYDYTYIDLDGIYYQEIYPAWIKRIIKRGDGVVKKAKLYKYWELPVGTIFTTGGMNPRIGGAHVCDEPFQTQYVVYAVNAVRNIEVNVSDDGCADGVTDQINYLVDCGEIGADGIVTDSLEHWLFDIVEVTSIIKRGNGGVKVDAPHKAVFKFNDPDSKKYYRVPPYATLTAWLFGMLTKKYNLPHDVAINHDEFSKILKQSWVKPVYFKMGTQRDIAVDHYLVDRKRAAKWIKQNINRITMCTRTKELTQTKNRNKAIELAKQAGNEDKWVSHDHFLGDGKSFTPIQRMSLTHLDSCHCDPTAIPVGDTTVLQQPPCGGFPVGELAVYVGKPN